MKNIALFYGGKSTEHSVSCKSAFSIYNNIDKTKFNLILIGITTDGLWYLQKEPSFEKQSLNIITNDNNLVYVLPGKGLTCNNELLIIDLAFPIIHGINGEDGTIQGLFELANIPYSGAGVIGSAIGMDKELIKRVWEHNNIPVVPFMVLKNNDEINIDEIETKFDYPIFIKPVNAGSSIGVSKAHNKNELTIAIDKAFKFDYKILIEKFVDAREIECAMLGNRDIQVFHPGEIIPDHEFYDFEAKYIDSNGAKLAIKADLEPSLLENILQTAKEAYKVAEIRGFCRLDFFVEKKTNNFYINEVNTLPGFTEVSMFPKICSNSGLTYSNLITKLIELGIEEYQYKSKFESSIE